MNGPFLPLPYRVVERRRETADVVTLSLEPLEGPPLGFRPGQFNMLTAFGIGEAAISVSSAPGGTGPLEHTIRDVGPVSHALSGAATGSVIGVRGPFGNDWGLDRLGGRPVVVVGGGIGLAPLRGAVRQLAAGIAAGGPPLTVLVGARSPEQLVFADEMAGWRAAGADVRVAVDAASPGWAGEVGVVAALVPEAPFDAGEAVAMLCGPEVMIRFTARALADRGVDPHRVLVSLERNMQCGVGLCGHCQLGPLLVCRDGPVFPYVEVERLMTERER